jgi:hypothetical protein
MRMPRFWSRFQAAIEGTAIGLSLGLIDIHSKDGDAFSSILTYLVAGIVLGVRHRGRSWQAWLPLGWCLYLMHRAAIGCGYRPPYVEEDAGLALRSLFILCPAGLGLAFGALARFAVDGYLWVVRFRPNAPNRVHSGTGTREITPDSDKDGAPSRLEATTTADPKPRERLTVRRLMVIVSVIGVHLATFRALLIQEPIFGFSTFYSEGYSESRFSTLRVGMTFDEVEAIVGRPLHKVPWNQVAGHTNEERWHYSDRPDYTANYWRREVIFEDGKVTQIFNDFWSD